MKNVLFVGLVVLGLMMSQAVQAATQAQADAARTTMNNTQADCDVVSGAAANSWAAASNSKNATEMKYNMYKSMHMGQGIPAVDAALAQANAYFASGQSDWGQGGYYYTSGNAEEMGSNFAYTTAGNQTDPNFKSMWYQDSINYADAATLRYGAGYWYAQYHYSSADDNFVDADCYYDAAFNLIP